MGSVPSNRRPILPADKRWGWDGVEWEVSKEGGTREIELAQNLLIFYLVSKILTIELQKCIAQILTQSQPNHPKDKAGLPCNIPSSFI